MNILESRITALEETLASLVRQFAYTGKTNGRLYMYTGGLSALEDAFELLGYPDPKPTPERECAVSGCSSEATCGMPTPDGYKRICAKHFREATNTFRRLTS